MWNRSVWLIWLIILPLALFLGYLLATPDSVTSFGFIGIVLFGISIPLLLRWHYPILIFSWNAMLVPFFLPGHPDFWILMALLSATISVLRRSIDREKSFLKAPLVTWPLLFLGAVVLVTANFSGGIGVRALGSDTFGGRKYVYIFAAIIGYFALTAQAIPKERAKFYALLFFLPGLTGVISNLAYMLGPSFYFLFTLFPANAAVIQASAEQAVGPSVVRIAGISTGCTAIFCALLAHNGIRELFNLRKPWKMPLLILSIFAGLLGGFRSAFIIFTMILFFLFFVEGLHRTRYLPIVAIGIILVSIVTLPFVTKLPYSMQRALSVLPIKVDPVARADAKTSTQWRVEMWKIVIPQIPHYFWKGKGYAIEPSDLYLAEELVQRGLAKSNEIAMLAGDYHSGPLSVIIPFGIFGVIAFLWFLIGSFRVLYLNHRFGDPDLKRINAFLLAFFLQKTVFFFAVYGAVESGLFAFVGVVGLSISLNGGVKRMQQSPVLMENENVVPVPA